LLREQKDPDDFYIKNIMPIKIELNKIYLSNRNVHTYFSIIFNTIVSFKKIHKGEVSTGQMNAIDTPK